MSGTLPTAASAARPPRLRARVERIFDHSAAVRSLFLRGDSPLPRFLPGMFISIAMPLATEIRTRPYTIVSNPEDRQPFEIVFNRVENGLGSSWLFDRMVGDEIEFTGPYGTFTLDQPAAAELVFIAEGTAIAPIRPMINRVLTPERTLPVVLLYGAETARHLYSAEFESLAKAHRSFIFDRRIVEESVLYADLTRADLTREVRARWVEADSDRSRHFYLCGIGQPVIELRDILRSAGYPRRAVHYERW